MSVNLTKMQQSALDGVRGVLRSSTGANGMSLSGFATALGMTQADSKALIERDGELNHREGRVYAGAYAALPNAVATPGNARFAAASRSGIGVEQAARQSLDIDAAIADARTNALRQKAQQEGR